MRAARSDAASTRSPRPSSKSSEGLLEPPPPPRGERASRHATSVMLSASKSEMTQGAFVVFERDGRQRWGVFVDNCSSAGAKNAASAAAATMTIDDRRRLHLLPVYVSTATPPFQHTHVSDHAHHRLEQRSRTYEAELEQLDETPTSITREGNQPGRLLGSPSPTCCAILIHLYDAVRYCCCRARGWRSHMREKRAFALGSSSFSPHRRRRRRTVTASDLEDLSSPSKSGCNVAAAAAAAPLSR